MINKKALLDNSASERDLLIMLTTQMEEVQKKLDNLGRTAEISLKLNNDFYGKNGIKDRVERIEAMINKHHFVYNIIKWALGLTPIGTAIVYGVFKGLIK